MKISVEFLSTVSAQGRFHVIPEGAKVTPMIARDGEFRLSRSYVKTLANWRIHLQSQEGREDGQSQITVMRGTPGVLVSLCIREQKLRCLQVEGEFPRLGRPGECGPIPIAIGT
jgi:hypothetical protein